MAPQHKVTISHDQKRKRVTLKIVRYSGGWRRGQQQITFTEREFFRALRESEIVSLGRLL